MNVGAPPLVARPKIGVAWLFAGAVASILAWLVAERASRRVIHPRFVEMLNAARTMQAASSVLRAEKEARGLMQSEAIDINRTGMIGQEHTGITTTLGDLPSKRTATNPDLAAVIVRQLEASRFTRGAPVALILSGSFVGADIAALVAVEALELKPVVIASLSASMFGANDPAFNLVDMHSALRAKTLFRAPIEAAVLGGEGGVGGGMEREGVAALRASAARENITIIEARPLPALVEALIARVDKAFSGGAPKLVINVGGALISLGTCLESYELPPGVSRPTSCTSGVPGLASRLAERGAPVLNIINFRRYAAENGLPFDPVPLPSPGDNRAVYGLAR